MKRIHPLLLAIIALCLTVPGIPLSAEPVATGTVEVDLSDALEPIEAEQAEQADLLRRVMESVTANSARIDALETGNPPPGPGDGDTGGTDPPDTTEPPTPPAGKETDLWLNVSHYRYTPVIEYKPLTGRYVVNDQRFIDLYSKWAGIRYLDWCGVMNREYNWTWANRVTQAQRDDPGWDKTGVPLEAIIAVANATKTHVWWCAPQQADLDYMKRAGDLFARDLDPSLMLYVEIGNEVWQSNYGWHYHQQANGDSAERFRLYAVDSAAKFKALINGAGGGGFPQQRLVRVMGGQKDNIGVLSSNVLKHIQPSDYDAVSCAGYFGDAPSDWINGPHGLKASVKAVQAHAALAKSVNKKLVIYELNQHITIDTVNTDYVDRDDVIAGVQTMIDTARAVGSPAIAVYSGAGRRYTGQPWPVYTDHYNARKIVDVLGWPKLDE